MSATQKFTQLLDIMAQLRDPDTGCPWDLAQDFTTIAPYTIEEAYEVVDAIARNNTDDLKDELGDLALQIVFHARMAEEAKLFTIEDVLDSINAKMTRRHPHIFGEVGPKTAAEVTDTWDTIKAAERAAKAPNTTPSALDGVALALPALMRAQKLAKRAARTGFDWTDPKDIFDKLDEETAELKIGIDNNDAQNIEEEIGDLLFVVTNLARRLGVDAETALDKANTKFTTRFIGMEAIAKDEGVDFASLSLTEQEALWQRVKTATRGPD